MDFRRHLAAFLAALIAVLPTHAIAAEALSGVCVNEVDPRLAQLSALIDEAACEAAEAVDVDSRVRTRVLRIPVFEGARDFGLPSGIQTDVEISWMFAPIVEPESAPKPSFFWSQYQAFSEAVGAWNAGTDQAGEFLAETFTYNLVGPEWAKNLVKTNISTGVEFMGGLIALGPNMLLMPQALWRTPEDFGSGATKIHSGLSQAQYELALEGTGEVCGAVGTLLSVALPIAKGIGTGRAPISIRPTAPQPISTAGALSLAQPKISYIAPGDLRWSQTSAGGKGRADALRTAIKENGYQDIPIDVVQTVDGLATLDHTRPLVAIELGVERIPARIHQPTDPLPAEMIGRFGDAKTWGRPLHIAQRSRFLPYRRLERPKCRISRRTRRPRRTES